MSEPASSGAAGVVVNESAWGAPAEGLRGFVDSYVGFRQIGAEPARHRGLPSPSLTLIFTLDEPLVLVAHPDPAQPPGTFETIFGGLHTSPAIITHDGRQSGIQLGLSPLGAKALLGVPAGELAQRDMRVSRSWTEPCSRGSHEPTRTPASARRSATPGGTFSGQAARPPSARWPPRLDGATATYGPGSVRRPAWPLRPLLASSGSTGPGAQLIVVQGQGSHSDLPTWRLPVATSIRRTWTANSA
jgi:hypothetical protein